MDIDNVTRSSCLNCASVGQCYAPRLTDLLLELDDAGLRSMSFGGHRSGGMKESVACSGSRIIVACLVRRGAVLLEDISLIMGNSCCYTAVTGACRASSDIHLYSALKIEYAFKSH